MRFLLGDDVASGAASIDVPGPGDVLLVDRRASQLILHLAPAVGRIQTMTALLTSRCIAQWTTLWVTT